MVNVLTWKEWRQLRQLRWVGAGLGVLLALVAITAPSGAKQGWIPFTHTARTYSFTEILMTALPLALVFGLWPLIALLTTSQSFAGDRSAGTESFLLERPVSRGSVWLARVTASFGSTTIVVLASAAVWALLAATVADPTPHDWSRSSQILLGVGSATTIGCLLGGMVAASLLSQPLAALLLGVVLVMVPVQIASTLGAWSSLATLWGVPAGLFAPLGLMLVYPVASFLASSRGEPAGRGRIVRGVVTLLAGFLITGLAFVATTTAAVRILAHELEWGAEVSASPSGDAMFASSFGGWIVDLDSAEKLRFLPPPIGGVGWSRDGAKVAVITSSGMFGSERDGMRLELFDREGRHLEGSVDFDTMFWTRQLRWVGDRIVWVEPSVRTVSRIESYSPATGERLGTDFELTKWSWSLVGPTDDDRIFLAVPDEEPSEDALDRSAPIRYAVVPFDPETGTLSDEPVVEDLGSPWLANLRLSRSGRFWLRERPPRSGEDADGDRRGESTQRTIVDLETGEQSAFRGAGRRAAWAAGDVLLWVEDDGRVSRLYRLDVTPGSEAVRLREWSELDVELSVSPDGRRLLIVASELLENPSVRTSDRPQPEFAMHRRVAETWVYDVEGEGWTRLEAWPREEFTAQLYRTEWAGPATLARTGPGVLAVESLDRPGERRAVVGSID